MESDARTEPKNNSRREVVFPCTILVEFAAHRGWSTLIPGGTMKLFAFPAGMPPDGSTASLMSQIWIGGVLEVVGGALVLGLQRRCICFVRHVGSGVLAVPRSRKHLAQFEWRGTRRALLLCLALYLGIRRWSLECGCKASQRKRRHLLDRTHTLKELHLTPTVSWSVPISPAHGEGDYFGLEMFSVTMRIFGLPLGN